jgi:hypothetical protein
MGQFGSGGADFTPADGPWAVGSPVTPSSEVAIAMSLHDDDVRALHLTVSRSVLLPPGAAVYADSFGMAPSRDGRRWVGIALTPTREAFAVSPYGKGFHGHDGVMVALRPTPSGTYAWEEGTPSGWWMPPLDPTPVPPDKLRAVIAAADAASFVHSPLRRRIGAVLGDAFAAPPPQCLSCPAWVVVTRASPGHPPFAYGGFGTREAAAAWAASRFGGYDVVEVIDVRKQ